MIPTLDPEERDQTATEFLRDIRSGMFPVVACARRGWGHDDYVARLKKEPASQRAVDQAEADCEAHLQGIVMAAAKGKATDPEESPEKPTGSMVDAAKWMLAKRFPQRWSDAFEGLPQAEPRAYESLVEDLRKYATGVEQKQAARVLEGAAVQ